MHSSAFTGCGSQSAYSTSWLFWRTRSYTEARHLTLVHVSTLLISVIDERSILLALTISLCHQSTVTVTEALVLRPLLEDRGRITVSIRIVVPVDRMKQKCFQITTKRVLQSPQFQPNYLQSAVEPSRSPLPNSGTTCLTTVVADLLSTFQRQLKHSVPAVLPRCCTVTVAQLCYCNTLSGPSGGSSYLGHYKNY